MKNKVFKRIIALVLAAGMLMSLTACGGGNDKVELNDGTFKEVDASELQFPLAETATLTGMIKLTQNQNQITEQSLNVYRNKQMLKLNGQQFKVTNGAIKSA